MRPTVLLSALFPALALAGCVSQDTAVLGGNAPPAACAEQKSVARQLAERHQYGGDLQGYIAELKRQGASPADVAIYQMMAKKIASVPMLAGDGGREMGVELALAELNLTCSP